MSRKDFYDRLNSIYTRLSSIKFKKYVEWNKNDEIIKIYSALCSNYKVEPVYLHISKDNTGKIFCVLATNEVPDGQLDATVIVSATKDGESISFEKNTDKPIFGEDVNCALCCVEKDLAKYERDLEAFKRTCREVLVGE